jgi:hypothetical protein
MKSDFDIIYERVMSDSYVMDEGFRDLALAGMMLVGSMIPFAIHRYVVSASKDAPEDGAKSVSKTMQATDVDQNAMNDVKSRLSKMGIAVGKEHSAIEKWLAFSGPQITESILGDLKSLKPDQIRYLESFGVFNDTTKDANINKSKAIGAEVTKGIMHFKAANAMIDNYNFDTRHVGPKDIIENTSIHIVGDTVSMLWKGKSRQYDISKFLSNMDIQKLKLVNKVYGSEK